MTRHRGQFAPSPVCQFSCEFKLVGEVVVRQIGANKDLPEGAGDLVALKRNGHFRDYPHLFLVEVARSETDTA